MTLGLAKDRLKDTFRFLNLETHKVIMSCEMIWMDAVYGDYKKCQNQILLELLKSMMMMTVILKLTKLI